MYKQIQIVKGVPNTRTAHFILPVLRAESIYSYYPDTFEAEQLLKAIEDGLEGEERKLDIIVRVMQYGYARGRDAAEDLRSFSREELEEMLED